MSPEDTELWKRVTSSVVPLGERSRDQYPMAALHVSEWPKAPLVAILDLHGLTLNQAHDAVRRFLRQARGAKIKRVTIVTGRSGSIRTEFPIWMNILGHSYSVLANDGSFSIRV